MRILLFIPLLLAAVFGANIYATFDVQPFKEANLAFNLGGIVQKVFVDVGDEVKQNQLLAALNSDDIKANLNIAKIELKYAQKNYQRQLKAKNAIDAATLDQFSFKKELAAAKLKQIKTTLDKSLLKAPFDGVISYKNIEVGDVVPGISPKVVYKIISTHKRKLVLKFDEKYLSRVRVGDSFIYTLDGSTKKYKGKISKIYPTVDSKTRKVTAEVLADDIKVGLFGSGTIVTKD